MFILLGINTIEGTINVSLAKEIQTTEKEGIPKTQKKENCKVSRNWIVYSSIT